MRYSLLILLLSAAKAQNTTQTYENTLKPILLGAGLGQLDAAFQSVMNLSSGQALVQNLYGQDKYTLYAPVDSAWAASDVVDAATGEDLVSLLSYHVATEIDASTQIAQPHHHTVSETKLNDTNLRLAGHPQVLVIETSPLVGQNPTPVLVRSAVQNATSQGNTSLGDLFIQLIDQVLPLPTSPLDTLAQPGLAIGAPLGTPLFLNLLNAIGQNDTIANCIACTFFIPVDSAFQAVSENLTKLDQVTATTMLQNHILNGTLAYSTDLTPGSTWVNSAGHTLAFLSDDSGSRIVGNKAVANILRSDLIVSNGVIHLIDAVLFDTAIAAARRAVGFMIETVIDFLSAVSSSSATSSPTSSAMSTSGACSHHPPAMLTNITAMILAAVVGVLWM